MSPPTGATDADVAAFLAGAATPRRREEGARLDRLFREVTGVDPLMWGPTMVGYGHYRYVSSTDSRTRGELFKVGFSPRRARLTFYNLTDRPGAAGLLACLGEVTFGAGCVYANALDGMDLDVLRQLIAIGFDRTDDPDPRAERAASV